MTKPNYSNYRTKVLRTEKRDETFWKDMTNKVYKDAKKDKVATVEILKKVATDTISQLEFNLTVEEDQIISNILSENSFEAWADGIELVSKRTGWFSCCNNKPKPKPKH